MKRLLTSLLLFLLIIISLTGLFSCNKTMPAGFWNNFKPNLVNTKIGKQGLSGGHSVIYWESSAAKIFTSEELVEYATKNGWELVSKTHFDADSLKKWAYHNKNIFPLSSKGFEPNNISVDSSYEKFPRWTTSGVTVFSFKTGWITVVPGTSESNSVNGFIMLSDNGQEVSLYHLWGE